MKGMMKTILRLIWLIIYKYEVSNPTPASENCAFLCRECYGYQNAPVLMLLDADHPSIPTQC
jgi:hypothetical protein